MMDKTDQNSVAKNQNKKLGTFAGVFTPSVLTILGIILFMRLGYVVGAGGIKQALLIIMIANLISVLTSISLSAIATNLTVRGGGDYFLISRTLGLEFGGAIGLVLFLAQSVSVGFYCIGFGEIFAGLLGGGSGTAQIVAVVAIGGLFILAWLGADWATRFQFIVMGILILALVSFFLGGWFQWDDQIFHENWNAAASGQGFWVLFAVFFPAVTGFTQGVSLSGDLEDPGKSLPLGTFLAVGISILVYFGAALVFAGVLPQDILLNDYDSMRKVAWLPVLIIAGVFAATLSSAMASFLGAPRILQALAADKIFPILNPFAKGVGSANNPRRGVLLAAGVALLTVSLGNLNLIASVVAMFFLISYGLLNYATYFEARTASPSFRPRFKWFHKRISLAGALVCLLVMLAIDWKAGALAVAVIYILYQYLQRTVHQARWADSRRSHHLQQVREHLLQVSQELEHPRDWRPQILAFSGSGEDREPLLHFAAWLEGKSGLTTLVRIITGHGALLNKQKQEAEDELYDDIVASGKKVFPLVITAQDFEAATSVLLQSFGIGPLRANTILFNHHSSYLQQFLTSSRKAYGKILRMALRLGYHLVIFDVEDQEWQQLLEQPADQRQIDVWYERDANGSLMLLLSYLMTRHPFWEHASFRVLLPVVDHNPQATKEALLEELEQVRITAEVVVVEDQETETLIAHSQQSSLVFLPVGLREGQLFDSAGTPIDDFLLRLPLVAMVLAAEDIQLDAEPDEGVAGQLAEAEDVVTAAEQRATDAEIEQHKTKQLFAESLKEFIEARQKNLSVEEITALDGELKNSEEERDKAIRRAAKADAKIEHAKKELELLRKRHHVSEDTT
ncbi:MAG: amino acid permease [Desulfuromusa sp.]|nr:amino acid permease [Desulfuromusa sp.]